MTTVAILDTPSLGDRTYLVHDGAVAVVIDPQRDIDRCMSAANDAGVRITHVLETHVHNDYVSGGRALADMTGATYALRGKVEVDHLDVADGERITTGSLVLRAMLTPGHTPDHVSWLLLDDDVVTHVFTGGSLLYGAVGRTDLIDDTLTIELSHEQFRSVRRLAAASPDEAEVQPTHGFGSHCASNSTCDTARSGTIGDERGRNPALLTGDADTFVADLLAGLHPFPAYYAHMGPINSRGAPAPALRLPVTSEPDDLRDHLDAGHWVIDLRARRAYAADHVRGTVNVELRNDLATYLGWVMPFDANVVLLGDDEEAVTEAQIMLSRIGIELPVGHATGDPKDWAPADERGSRIAAAWSDLKQALGTDDSTVVLDVRDHWEFVQGHHPRAINIPFHEVLSRIDELPPQGDVWISCATGNRAAVAASLLAREGRRTVLVDDFCLPGDVPPH